VFFFPLVEHVRRIRAHAPIVDFGVERNIYLTYVTKICGTNLKNGVRETPFWKGFLRV
jgi:hypothetical protein